MKLKQSVAAVIAALSAGFASTAVRAATEADVNAIFSPYGGSASQAAAVQPGTVINKSNVAQIKDLLNPGSRLAIENGWYEIKVGKTLSFDPHTKYVEETKKHLNKAKLGDKLGLIQGYAGGLPFPEEPKVDDPRAGEKLAWNFKYNFGAGDGSKYEPFFYKFRNLNDGKTERSIQFGYYVQKHKFRVVQTPVPEIAPNPSNVFRSFYIRVTDPQDIKDTQLLIQRSLDDTLRDDAYLYLGFQRRVRRLATGQTTDPFLGTDLMIEDFEGYNARVSDQTWTFKGSTTTLLPMYAHNEQRLTDEEKQADGYKFVAPTGKGNCFMDVTWQPRKAFVVEGVPTDPSHPVGKRVFYIDAQTFTIPHTLIYDRKGELWKVWSIGIAHPDHHLAANKGTGVPLFDAFSMVDVQSKHCTFGMIKGQVVQPPTEIFSVQQMRGGTN